MSLFLNYKLEKFMLKYVNKTGRELTYDYVSSFIGKFKEPKDEYEMSYDRFLCRMSTYPFIVSFGANVLSFFAVLASLVTTVIPGKRIPEKHNNKLLLEKHYSVPYNDILPDALRNGKDDLIETEYCNKKFGILCKEAKKVFFKCLVKYPFHFFFLYLTYKELVAHSFFLLDYNPAKVAVYVNERNPALPLLTRLYEDHNRELISFMHGEYNLQIVHAFMSFSEYYVWSEKNITTMKDILRCDIKKYVVYTPIKETKKWHLEEIAPDYDFTYYLNGEEDEQIIKRIFETLDLLKSKGYKSKCRVHPRNTVNLPIVMRYANDYLIEYPKEVSLEQSLGSTKNAIGLGTTVLIDAITEGRSVILDDISNPFRFNHLKELGNRSFDMEYTLLSDLVATIKDKN